MNTAIYIISVYVSCFVILYGGVWCSRRISKSLRRRRLRKSLKDNPIDYAERDKEFLRKRARDMATGSSSSDYNKQALGRLIRHVTKKSKYN